MTQPANLSYAFPLVYAAADIIGENYQTEAYRVIGSHWDGEFYRSTRSLEPGTDLADAAADGGGNVGEFVIFIWNADIAGGPNTREEAATLYGFDPFDPVNHVVVPGSAPLWQLESRSGVPATSLAGVGPVARLDENCAVVIGDIAYIVSGFPLNQTNQLVAEGRGASWTPAVQPRVDSYVRAPGGANIVDVPIGSTLLLEYPGWDPQQFLEATALPNYFTVNDNGTWETTWTIRTIAAESASGGDYCWPYLERYNLRTKQWLPRVLMPMIDGHPYAAEGGFAGVINGKLYFGGGDGTYITGREFFVYNPATHVFTRLPDTPETWTYDSLDYRAYGVIGQTLWGFGLLETNDGGTAQDILSYDVGATEWVLHDRVLTDAVGGFVNDHIKGVELDGKLYFVYNRVYVFDPVTLTITRKAACPNDLSMHRPFGVTARDGKIYAAEDGEGFEYDPVADSWSSVDGLMAPVHTYSAVVDWRKRQYVLSGMFGTYTGLGIWGTTGGAFSYTAPAEPKNLIHRGFTTRQALLLQDNPADASFRELLRAGFSPRQVRTIKRGEFTMKALLRGGFSRAQAKTLADI